jgi:hypothetical protein
MLFGSYDHVNHDTDECCHIREGIPWIDTLAFTSSVEMKILLIP